MESINPTNPAAAALPAPMGEMQGFPLSDTKIRTIRAVSKT